MPEEALDIFDEKQNPLGVAGKAEAHRLGLWHYAFHCWLYRVVDAGADVRLLFQQRGPDKALYPGLFDISAAGHYRAGEAVADGVREVEEELGIAIPFEDLVELGVRAEVFEAGDIISREFCRTFLGRTALGPAALRPAEPEVTALVEVPVADGLAMCAGARPAARCSGIRHWAGRWHRYESELSLRDLVPRPAAYYLDIFRHVEQACGGLSERADQPPPAQ
jgi:isopentenyldiphosphate isomerase